MNLHQQNDHTGADVKWKRVFSSPQQHIATLVCGALESRGLPAVLLNKRDTNYPFGFVEVHVPHHVAHYAEELIANEINF